MNSQKLKGFLLAVLTTGFALPAAQAEESPAPVVKTSPGAIVGIVTNSAKLPVAGATVTATRVDGSGIRATVSSNDGVYSFADLAPGAWSITVQVDGYPDATVPSLQVAASKATRHDLVMNVPAAAPAALPALAAAQKPTAQSTAAQSETAAQAKPVVVAKSSPSTPSLWSQLWAPAKPAHTRYPLRRALHARLQPSQGPYHRRIRASLPPSMTLDAGTEATRKMRDILLSHPEIVTVISQHGRPDNGSDPSPFSNVEMFVPLKPFDDWPRGLTKAKLTTQLEKEMRTALPGVTFNFSQYIQDNIEEAISGVKGANSVKIIGQDLTVLEDLARQVMGQMSQVRGVQDLGVFHVLGQPNLNIKIDRARTARYGLNTGDVNTVVQAAMGGAVASQVLEGDRFFNLTVRLAPQYRNSVEAIGNIKVGYQTSSGANAYIPLRELATISLDTGPAYIYHEAMDRDIQVKFSARGRDLGSTVAEVQERIAHNVKFPRGYRLEWADEFQDLQLAKQRLAVFVPMSLGLILILLYSLFNSVRDSLLAHPQRHC